MAEIGGSSGIDILSRSLRSEGVIDSESCRPLRNRLRGNAHDSRRIFFSGYLHRRTPIPTTT